MAELLTSKPLFPGQDHIDQLQKTMALVGTPGKDLLAKITSEDVRSPPILYRSDYSLITNESLLASVESKQTSDYLLIFPEFLLLF